MSPTNISLIERPEMILCECADSSLSLADWASIIGVAASIVFSYIAFKDSKKALHSSEYDNLYGSALCAGIDKFDELVNQVYAISSQTNTDERKVKSQYLLNNHSNYSSKVLLACTSIDKRFGTKFEEYSGNLVDLICDSLENIHFSRTDQSITKCKKVISGLEKLKKASSKLRDGKINCASLELN